MSKAIHMLDNTSKTGFKSNNEFCFKCEQKYTEKNYKVKNETPELDIYLCFNCTLERLKSGKDE